MLFSPFNYLYSNIHIRTFNGIPLVTNIIWIISFSQIHTLKFRCITFQGTCFHICQKFVVSVLNVAAGKAPMQSSVADGGIPQKAVDGSTSTFFDDSTCTLTDVERAPWWYVNLLEPYMVQLVRIDFGQSCCGK